MNPTMTLGAIHKCRPRKSAWERLLVGLGYANGNYDPDHLVSLGDIGMTNNAADALWCIRALDWRGLAVRRAVIAGAILPTVRRASVHTADERVHDCIERVEHWCAGNDGISDLAVTVLWKVVRASARAETWANVKAAWTEIKAKLSGRPAVAEPAAAEAAMAAKARAWAAETALAAAKLMKLAKLTKAGKASGEATWEVAWAARVEARRAAIVAELVLQAAVTAARAVDGPSPFAEVRSAGEIALQRQDIIKAFPPIVGDRECKPDTHGSA